MKKKMIICLSVLLFLLLTGCVTNTMVTFDALGEHVDVIIDGEYVGTTPFTTSMGNEVWSEPSVVLKNENYRNRSFNLKKEIKPVNLIFGILGWWPSYLWVYGPSEYQSIVLNEWDKI